MNYLKKHIFLKIFTLFFILFGALFYLRLDGVFKTIEQKYKLELISHNSSTSELIQRHLLNAKKDLLYLADIYQALKKSIQHYEHEYIQDLELIIEPFMIQRNVYSQILYLNLDGQEILRVDHKDGEVTIADQTDLQNKSSHYYVKDSKILHPGEIYLSKLDLNIENDQIEEPYDSVIRLSSPVLDENNKISGYVIINYSGQAIIDELEKNDGQIHSLLLDKESHYLKSDTKDNEWGHLLKNDVSFKKHHPKQWKQIVSAPSGEFLLNSSFYAFLHLDPVQVVSPHRKSLSKRNWVILSYICKDIVQDTFFEYVYSIWWIIVSIILIALLFSYLLTRYIKVLNDVNQRMDIAYEAFKHSSDSIIVLNKNIEIIQVNRAFEKMTGYRENEVLFKNPKFLKDPAYRYEKSFFKEMWKKINTNEFWSGEVHNIRKNLEPYVQHLSIGVVKRDAKVTHYIGVSSDVTEHKRLEAQMIQARKVAEKANQAKNIFLANVSHEIRTPMNAILGYCELLTATQLDSQQSNYMTKTINAAHSLLSILNDMLDLSKIEAGQTRLKVLPFKPENIIKQSVDILSLSAQKKSLELTYEVDENIPEYLIGDPERIRQVLINLIGNAIKFTQTGSVHINLFTLHKNTQSCTIEFAVSDTGIGIAKQNHADLFEYFTQVDSSKTREKGGTGLGLAISKQLVKAMDGSIEVESEPGQGSTFSFKLKLDIAQSVPSKQILLPEYLFYFGNMYILLVEDNSENREVAGTLLKKMGIDVDEAVNGEVAIEMVRKKKYDMVLMDIQMPKLDGLSATKILRSEGFTDLLIIALSAHTSEIECKNSLDAGMNDHLNKPFTMYTLQNLLVQWLPNKIVKKIRVSNTKENSWVNQLPPIPGLVLDDEMSHYWLKKEDFLDKLKLFVHNTVKEANTLHTMIDKKNTSTALKSLHKLKGSVKLYGANRLFAIIEQLETVLKKNDNSDISDLLHQFDDAVSELSS